MDNNQVKTREWVKTAAIIFLAVLLVFTFFSNTFMNLTLPQVASQMVESGSITAKIRGSGTVSANEAYEVQIPQTRKVHSVPVREGQSVEVGDVLLVLEADDSEELKTAENELSSMQAAYDKALIEAGNSAAQNSYEVKTAQAEYDEALAIYRQYSDMDADALAKQTAAAENELEELKTKQTEAQEEYDSALADSNSAEAELAEEEAKTQALEKACADALSAKQDMESLKDSYDDAYSSYQRHASTYDRDYAALCELANNNTARVEYYVENEDTLVLVLRDKAVPDPESRAGDMIVAYHTINNLSDAEKALENAVQNVLGPSAAASDYDRAVSQRIDDYENAKKELSDQKKLCENLKDDILSASELNELKKDAEKAAKKVSDKESEIANLSKAASAAETVKSTQKALEDLLFRQSLKDSGAIDLRLQRQELEKKQAEVTKLRENQGETEVTAAVAGMVTSISVSAGVTASADTSLMTINLIDRGYTVKIPVTVEQSKKVRIGDSAEVVNSWWGSEITAVLERMEKDPSNPAQSKLLVFRLDGDVEPDQNLTLSIGQKSASYDAIVPNSAIRSGNNGTAVLVLNARSGPLGNRFTVTEVPVQVLAQDDTRTAISGVGSGEFVVTTSTEPLKNGQSVRQADET